MSSLLLAYSNRADGGSLSGGSWWNPVTNLQDKRLARVARTNDCRLTSTRLRCDLKARYPLRAMSLHAHNLSTAAQVRWRCGRASLDILFDSDTVDERITFSGGANGTRINSRGLMQASTRSNLAPRSQEFENASWTKTSATITANAIAGPFDPYGGPVTADALVEAAGAVSHMLSQSITTVVGTTYTQSIYVKAGLRDKFLLQFYDGTTDVQFKFDLAAVSATLATAGPNDSSIAAVGRGWYRVSLTALCAATAGSFRLYPLDANGSLVYSGSTASPALYLWGAQLEIGPVLTDYIATTTAAATVTDPRIDYDPRNRVTNLVYPSQNFSAWNQDHVAAAGGYTAPDGTNTAFCVTEDTTNGAHRIYVSGPNSTAGLGVYSSSIYLKAGTRSSADFVVSDNATGVMGATMNLVTGTVALSASAAGSWAGVSFESVSAGNGWWRVSVHGYKGNAAGNCLVMVYLLDSNSSASYTGNGTGSIYVWGAQLQAGPNTTAYIPTVAAPASAYQDFGAIRTNRLPFSQEFDRWDRSGETGSSVSANSVVAPDGTPTADAYTWPSSGTTFAYLPSLTKGDASKAYTYSVWAKVPSGTLSLSICISDFNAHTANGSPNTLTTAWQRISFSVPAGALANTGYLGAGLFGGPAAGNVIHLWGAQLEEGAVATDYIQTFSTARTSPDGCRGLLVEEARTNLLQYSQNLALSPWSGNVTATLSPTLFRGFAPFYTLAKTTSGGSESRAQDNATTTTTSDYITATIALLAGTSSQVQVGIYDSAGGGVGFGVIGANDAEVLEGPGTLSNVLNALITVTGLSPTVPTVLRITKPPQAAGGNAGLFIYPGTSTSTTIGDSVLATACQMEKASFATSYIPTASTPVTRGADNNAMSGSNFTSWFTSTTGTLYADFTASSTSRPVASIPVELSDTTFNNRIAPYLLTSDNRLAIYVDAASTALNAATAIYLVPNSPCRTAIRWDGSTGAISTSGRAVQSGATASPVGLNKLTIGHDGNNGEFLNGHVKRIGFFPGSTSDRLADIEMQAITTGGLDSIGYNSGWINALQLAFQGDAPAAWGLEYMVHTTLGGAAISARFLSLEISDTANAAGYVQAGRLVAAGGFQPAKTASYGLQSGRADLSSVTTSISGVRYATPRRRPRSEQFQLQYVTQAEADRIHEMHDEIGTVDEVVYVPDAADAAYSQRYGFLGYLEQLGALDYPFPLRRSVPFQIKEKL
ncbi:hypothetical protein ACFPOE_11340 [Caenimonas terrae]|uniref:Peptidase S74 domain-containing protein n=1 Tax=Caenimonas terrae TaxID=696074 RepID=A0ABW0NDV1_9BURK